MAIKITPCGVRVIDRHEEVLLGHATGSAHWDIPKGIPEPDETPRDTAAREVLEETGLRLDPKALLDLGRFAYRPRKDLHLFAILSDRVEPSGCVCSSQFMDRSGRLRPEIDAFEWTPFERVTARCARSMAAVLTGPVSLRAVAAQLMSGSAAAARAPPNVDAPTRIR